MQDKVNILLNLVTPYKLCQDLGLEVFFSETSASIRNPKVNSEFLHITEVDFISQHYNKTWFRGNIIDFLCYVENITYRDAVSYVVDRYLLNSKDSFYKSIAWNGTTISKYVEHNNLLVSGIRELSLTMKDSPKLSIAREKITSMGLSLNHAGNFMCAAVGRDIIRVMEDSLYMTMKSSQAVKFHANDVYIMYPYYANHHTIAYIEAVHVKTGWVNKIDIHKDYRKSYLGMDTFKPSDPFVTICRSKQDLIDKYVYNTNYSPESPGCVFVRKSSGSIMSAKLNRCLVRKDEHTNIEELVDHLQDSEDLRISFSNKNSSLKFSSYKTVREFIKKNFFFFLSKEVHATEAVLEYAEKLKRDEYLRRVVFAELKSMGRTDVLDKLNLELVSSEYITVRGNKVSHTPDGYIITSREGDVTQLTNFGIKLMTTIVFRNTEDIYYRGSMDLSGKDYPIMLSRKSTQNHRLLVAALTSAVAEEIDISDEDAVTPAILDTTCKAYVNNIIANEIHSTGMEIGLDRMGWDKSGTQFSSSSWKVSSSGISFEPRTLYPGEENLNKFQYKDLNLGDEVPEVSCNALHVFGLITSLIYCYRSSTSISPMYVRDNPVNREKLFSLLNAFSQKDPIYLNNNYRKNTSYINFVHGHPIICIAPNVEVLESIDEPLFVLCDSGVSFDFIEDSEEDLKKFSNKLYSKLLSSMCRSDLNFRITVDSYSLKDMVELGSNINTQVLGCSNPSESEFLTANSEAGEIIKFTQDIGDTNDNTGSTSTSIPSI